MARTIEMAWEQKKTNAEGSGTHIQGSKHHLLVPSQYRRHGPSVKGLRGCDLMVGGKGVHFRVPAEASFRENA